MAAEAEKGFWPYAINCYKFELQRAVELHVMREIDLEKENRSLYLKITVMAELYRKFDILQEIRGCLEIRYLTQKWHDFGIGLNNGYLVQFNI